MSQENVEIVIRAEKAMNRRDADAFVACLSPDVEWEENDEGFTGLRSVYRGPDEVRKWFGEVLVEPWEDIDLVREEIAEGPNGRVFWAGSLTARGKGSGVEAELRFWSVLWVREGQITRRQVFLNNRAEALEAAGLRE